MHSFPSTPPQRRWLPATTVPIARAASGVLLAVACTIGWAVIHAGGPSLLAQELSSQREHYAYMLVATAFVLAAFGYGFGRIEERLRRTNHRLVELASIDELTGVPNARVFHNELPKLISLARRAGLDMALVIFDLDLFKVINDRHGHAVGDAVLHSVGAALRLDRRREDVVARIGGEEFAMILPGVNMDSARAVAERAAKAVRAIHIASTPQITVTVSAGVASLEPTDSPETLFARADAALYAAKHAGRDRVERALPLVAVGPVLGTQH